MGYSHFLSIRHDRMNRNISLSVFSETKSLSSPSFFLRIDFIKFIFENVPFIYNKVV